MLGSDDNSTTFQLSHLMGVFHFYVREPIPNNSVKNMNLFHLGFKSFQFCSIIKK